MEPAPLPFPPLTEADLARLRASDLFDAGWYRARYPDVARLEADLGLAPLAHFLWIGHRMGRRPSEGFDTRGYLAAHPGVAGAGVNPLLHHLREGTALPQRCTRQSGELPPQPGTAGGGPACLPSRAPA